MRVEDVAQAWGISARQVYRLIRDGTLPATRKPRDRPVVGYEVNELDVRRVQAHLASLPMRRIGDVKKILQGDL